MIKTNKSTTTSDIVKILGERFKSYRLQLRMTRKEVSQASAVGMTTLYKLESGNLTDISFRTLVKLLKVIGLSDNWEHLLPELPESPYSYNDKNKKLQRVRHSKNEIS